MILFILFASFLLIPSLLPAQEIRINPDGTHSIIHPISDNLGLIINPDGTHTVVFRINDTNNFWKPQRFKPVPKKRITVVFDQHGFKLLEYRYKRKKTVHILIKPNGENIIIPGSS